MSKRDLDATTSLRLLEPGSTVLVTSMFRSHPNVMTAAWLSPLSFDPTLISLAIHPGRLTHELVSKSEMLGVSFPTMDLVRAVHRCGMRSGYAEDKFETAGLTPVDPREIEAPRIDECVAHIECGLVERFSLADHDLFIAQILHAEADDQHFTDRWIADDDLPLVHHIAGNTYAGLSRSYAASLDEDDEDSYTG